MSEIQSTNEEQLARETANPENIKVKCGDKRAFACLTKDECPYWHPDGKGYDACPYTHSPDRPDSWGSLDTKLTVDDVVNIYKDLGLFPKAPDPRELTCQLEFYMGLLSLVLIFAILNPWDGLIFTLSKYFFAIWIGSGIASTRLHIKVLFVFALLSNSFAHVEAAIPVSTIPAPSSIPGAGDSEIPRSLVFMFIFVAFVQVKNALQWIFSTRFFKRLVRISLKFLDRKIKDQASKESYAEVMSLAQEFSQNWATANSGDPPIVETASSELPDIDETIPVEGPPYVENVDSKACPEFEPYPEELILKFQMQFAKHIFSKDGYYGEGFNRAFLVKTLLYATFSRYISRFLPTHWSMAAFGFLFSILPVENVNTYRKTIDSVRRREITRTDDSGIVDPKFALLHCSGKPNLNQSKITRAQLLGDEACIETVVCSDATVSTDMSDTDDFEGMTVSVPSLVSKKSGPLVLLAKAFADQIEYTMVCDFLLTFVTTKRYSPDLTTSEKILIVSKYTASICSLFSFLFQKNKEKATRILTFLESQCISLFGATPNADGEDKDSTESWLKKALSEVSVLKQVENSFIGSTGSTLLAFITTIPLLLQEFVEAETYAKQWKLVLKAIRSTGVSLSKVIESTLGIAYYAKTSNNFWNAKGLMSMLLSVDDFPAEYAACYTIVNDLRSGKTKIRASDAPDLRKRFLRLRARSESRITNQTLSASEILMMKDCNQLLNVICKYIACMGSKPFPFCISLDGPPGTGKTTFMPVLLKKCTQWNPYEDADSMRIQKRDITQPFDEEATNAGTIQVYEDQASIAVNKRAVTLGGSVISTAQPTFTTVPKADLADKGTHSYCHWLMCTIDNDKHRGFAEELLEPYAAYRRMGICATVDVLEKYADESKKLDASKLDGPSSEGQHLKFCPYEWVWDNERRNVSQKFFFPDSVCDGSPCYVDSHTYHKFLREKLLDHVEKERKKLASLDAFEHCTENCKCGLYSKGNCPQCGEEFSDAVDLPSNIPASSGAHEEDLPPHMEGSANAISESDIVPQPQIVPPECTGWLSCKIHSAIVSGILAARSGNPWINRTMLWLEERRFRRGINASHALVFYPLLNVFCAQLIKDFTSSTLWLLALSMVWTCLLKKALLRLEHFLYVKFRSFRSSSSQFLVAYCVGAESAANTAFGIAQKFTILVIAGKLGSMWFLHSAKPDSEASANSSTETEEIKVDHEPSGQLVVQSSASTTQAWGTVTRILPQGFECSKTIVMADLLRKVTAQTFRCSFTVKGKSKSQEITMLNSNVGMTTAHILVRSGKSYRPWIRFPNGKLVCPCIDAFHVSKGKDLVFIHMGGAPMGALADITKYLALKGPEGSVFANIKYSHGTESFQVDSMGLNYSTSEGTKTSYSYNGYVTNKTLGREYHGCCGTSLISSGKDTVIFAIHAASHDEKCDLVSKKIMFCPVVYEDYTEAARSFLDAGLFIDLPLEQIPVRKAGKPLVMAEVKPNHPVNFLSNDSFYYGCLPVFETARTEMKINPNLGEAITHLGLKPQKFLPVMNWKRSGRKILERATDSRFNLDQQYVRNASKYLSDKLWELVLQYKKNFPEVPFDRPLTAKELLNGIDGAFSCMDISKSSMIGGKKSKYVEIHEVSGKEVRLPTSEFQEDVMQCMQELCEGKNPFFVSKSFMKDELVSPKKIEEKVCRLVYGSPFTEHMCLTSHFKYIVEAINQRPQDISCAVGMDPHGQEWIELMGPFYGPRFTPPGEHPFVLAADVSGFDASQESYTRMFSVSPLVEINRRRGFSERDMKISEGLGSTSSFPNIAVAGAVMKFLGLQNSGLFITLLLNSEQVKTILFVDLHRFVENVDFGKKCEELGADGFDFSHYPNASKGIFDFDENHVAAIMGDDHIYLPSLLIKAMGWDASHFQETATLMGFTLTNPDKTPDLKMIDFRDAEFLKAFPTYNKDMRRNVHVVSPKSLLQMFYANVRGKDWTHESYTLDCVSNVIRTAIWYGRDPFEEIRARCVSYVSACGMPDFLILDMTYDDWIDVVTKDKDYVAQEDIFGNYDLGTRYLREYDSLPLNIDYSILDSAATANSSAEKDGEIGQSDLGTDAVEFPQEHSASIERMPVQHTTEIDQYMSRRFLVDRRQWPNNKPVPVRISPAELILLQPQIVAKLRNHAFCRWDAIELTFQSIAPASVCAIAVASVLAGLTVLNDKNSSATNDQKLARNSMIDNVEIRAGSDAQEAKLIVPWICPVAAVSPVDQKGISSMLPQVEISWATGVSCSTEIIPTFYLRIYAQFVNFRAFGATHSVTPGIANSGPSDDPTLLDLSRAADLSHQIESGLMGRTLRLSTAWPTLSVEQRAKYIDMIWHMRTCTKTGRCERCSRFERSCRRTVSNHASYTRFPEGLCYLVGVEPELMLTVAIVMRTWPNMNYFSGRWMKSLHKRGKLKKLRAERSGLSTIHVTPCEYGVTLYELSSVYPNFLIGGEKLSSTMSKVAATTQAAAALTSSPQLALASQVAENASGLLHYFGWSKPQARLDTEPSSANGCGAQKVGVLSVEPSQETTPFVLGNDKDELSYDNIARRWTVIRSHTLNKTTTLSGDVITEINVTPSIFIGGLTLLPAACAIPNIFNDLWEGSMEYKLVCNTPIANSLTVLGTWDPLGPKSAQTGQAVGAIDDESEDVTQHFIHDFGRSHTCEITVGFMRSTYALRSMPGNHKNDTQYYYGNIQADSMINSTDVSLMGTHWNTNTQYNSMCHNGTLTLSVHEALTGGNNPNQTIELLIYARAGPDMQWGSFRGYGRDVTLAQDPTLYTIPDSYDDTSCAITVSGGQAATCNSAGFLTPPKLTDEPSPMPTAAPTTAAPTTAAPTTSAPTTAAPTTAAPTTANPTTAAPTTATPTTAPSTATPTATPISLRGSPGLVLALDNRSEMYWLNAEGVNQGESSWKVTQDSGFRLFAERDGYAGVSLRCVSGSARLVSAAGMEYPFNITVPSATDTLIFRSNPTGVTIDFDVVFDSPGDVRIYSGSRQIPTERGIVCKPPTGVGWTPSVVQTAPDVTIYSSSTFIPLEMPDAFDPHRLIITAYGTYNATVDDGVTVISLGTAGTWSRRGLAASHGGAGVVKVQTDPNSGIYSITYERIGSNIIYNHTPSRRLGFVNRLMNMEATANAMEEGVSDEIPMYYLGGPPTKGNIFNKVVTGEVSVSFRPLLKIPRPVRIYTLSPTPDGVYSKSFVSSTFIDGDENNKTSVYWYLMQCFAGVTGGLNSTYLILGDGAIEVSKLSKLQNSEKNFVNHACGVVFADSRTQPVTTVKTPCVKLRDYVIAGGEEVMTEHLENLTIHSWSNRGVAVKKYKSVSEDFNLIYFQGSALLKPI